MISNEITVRGSGGFTRDDFGKALKLVERNTDLLQGICQRVLHLEETPG